MKRSIRLKEWGVSEFLLKSPDVDYSRLRRNCPVEDYVIRTNEQGFMLSGNDFNYGDANKTYIFLGDSFVESMFIQENRRFHSLLEKKLWDSGKKVACYNGGYSGATSLHLINVILNKVIPSNPDIVFYTLPSNDAFALKVESGVWGRSKVASPFVPHGTGFENVSFGLKDIRSLIKGVHEVLAAFGIRVVFMTFPHRSLYSSGGVMEEKFKTEKRFLSVLYDRVNVNEILRSYCERRCVALIDFEKIIDPFENFSQDDLHLDKVGSEVMADTIYEWCFNDD